MQLLYARHKVRLFRFALRFIQNPAVAEDVVQDVFLDVWRKADKFKGCSELSTWLLAIVRNKALTALRHRSVEPLDEDGCRHLRMSARACSRSVTISGVSANWKCWLPRALLASRYEEVGWRCQNVLIW